jgi:RHS repeat-associated protein
VQLSTFLSQPATGHVADIMDFSYNFIDSSSHNNGNVQSIANNIDWHRTQSFTYDPFGNIDKSGSPFSFQPTYSPTTNRITAIGTFTPTYDSNGNVTSDSFHTYTWDADGHPITVDQGKSDAVSLTYDALSRMVEQNRSGAYSQIVYAPTGAKLALMNGQTLTLGFAPLPGGGTAVYTSGGLARYRHPDWLGSARLASSPTRAFISDVAYAPFGETYASSGVVDISFTGQNSDTVPGDYDFLYREYSTQGRWTSPDPAGLSAVSLADPQSLNRYAYARNSPTSLTDPLGLCFECRDLPECTLDGVDTPCSLVFSILQIGNPGRSSASPGASMSGGTFAVWSPADCVAANETDSNPNGGPPNNSFFPLGCQAGNWTTVTYSGNTSGGFFSGILNRTKTVNRCAGQLSQAGSVSNLSGGRVPEVLGSNFFGDVASLATGSGGLDQGAGVAADLTAHAAPAIASQVAVGTMTSIGTAISHTAGVYNPVTVGTTTITAGMTTAGRFLIGAAEGVLTGKVLLDAGVYVGALVVCSQ